MHPFISSSMFPFSTTKVLAVTLLLLPSSWSLAEDCVLLFHGLGSHSLVLKPIELVLDVQPEYRVVNLGYSSYSTPLPELADSLIEDGLEACALTGDERVDLVTHSMGGLILRSYLTRHSIEALRRVVMIAPPNKGSEIVDLMEDFGAEGLLGESGRQLGAGESGIFAELPAVEFELGVIAGYTEGTLFGSVLPGADDGRVTVASTHVEGQADHWVVEGSHSGLLRKKEVIEQVISFLRYGHFMLSADEEIAPAAIEEAKQ